MSRSEGVREDCICIMGLVGHDVGERVAASREVHRKLVIRN